MQGSKWDTDFQIDPYNNKAVLSFVLSAKNRDKYGKEMVIWSNEILCNKQQEFMRWEEGDGAECQERVLVQ